jgi:hypothetical protein
MSLQSIDLSVNPIDETIRIGPLVVRFLVTGENSGGTVAVFEVVVPAGQRLMAPSHSHDHYEETVYGIEGVLTWTVDYWPDNLMKRHIRPVAKAIGINKNIGWHTFRHSFGTLLKANGEDVKTVQELLRHANSRITLDVYTQAVNSNKRAAQSKVVRMMVSSVGTKVASVGTTESRKEAAKCRLISLLCPYCAQISLSL